MISRFEGHSQRNPYNGVQIAGRWEHALWRARMDSGIDGFTFEGGDAVEEPGDALATDIQVPHPALPCTWDNA